MSKINVFINKYFANFLAKCQVRSPFSEEEQKTHIPPTCIEVEMLIPYLQKQEIDPVIVGSLAVIKHLNITIEDIQNRTFRPTHALELFVSKDPLTPPEGWKIEKESSNRLAWISPGGGYVLFLIAGIKLPDGTDCPAKIGKDPESVLMDCPVADITTLFKMKLNSDHEIDLYDLMCLVRRVGMPKDIKNQVLNKKGAKNLEFLKRWVKLQHSKNNFP